MSDIEVFECKYNKFGFCKYCDQCTRLHYTEKCNNLAACSDIKRCPKRHPKACKQYSLERFCRFGNSCSYEHCGQQESNKESENALKIKELEKSVKDMSEKIKHMESELAKSKMCAASHSNNSNDISCEDCDYRCKKNSSLRKHINTKHGKVKCLECGKEFKTSTELQMHLNDCYSEHAKKNDQDDQTKENKPCSICKKDFTTMTQLCEHFQEKHVDEEKGSDCYFTNHKILLDLEKEKAQIDDDEIDKLIMECRKDLLSDSEDFDE